MKIILSIIAAALCCTAAISQASPPQKSAMKPTTSTTAPGAAPASQATKAPAAAAEQAPGAALDPAATVITLTGLCGSGAQQSNCTRSISRADFEKLLTAISPNIPPGQRRSIAGLYAQLLAMASEGEKLGVDKDPTFEENLKLQRLRLLAQGAEKRMQADTKPTEQQIEAFYKENAARFEQVGLRRITVPKTIAGQSKPDETKALAQKIQQRAATGEDTDKLQAEVWLTTKATGAPPSTSQGLKRRGMMDPRHESQILQLKAGEVTPLIEDAQSFYIYKVDSKRTIPLKEVEQDISGSLQREYFQEKLQQVISSVKADLNEAYFGPAGKEEVPGPRHPEAPPEGERPPKQGSTPPK